MFFDPNQVITYLGINCDSHRMKFLVPEERKIKYIPLLQQLLTQTSVTYSEIEIMVGKLVSLECLYQLVCGIPGISMLP